MNLRVTAYGRTAELPRAVTRSGPAPRPTSTTRAHLDGDWHDTTVYGRGSLHAGAAIAGPAIVLEDACTTAIPPGWAARVSPVGHLVLDRESNAA